MWPGLPNRLRKSDLFLGGVLFLLVLTTYLPALRGGFVWDDIDNVAENRTLRSSDGLKRIWTEPGAVMQYYPLTYSSFWAEYRLWRLAPGGYHLVNVLLHAINAILVWIILRRLSVAGAWLAAALFAVHPVNVESVAWITERKNVLSGLFYLAALLAYIRFARLDEDAGVAGRPPSLVAGTAEEKRWYAAAIGFFVCGLLSKTAVCTLPVAILLIIWWRHGRWFDWDDVELLIPMFALAAATGVVTIWMEKHVSDMGWEWSFSAVERLLIGGRALVFYAMKLVWPAGLAFIYPRWTIDSSAIGQFLFPLATAAFLAGLWLTRARIGRAPLAAAAFFAVTLAPALGFVNFYFMRYSFVADRFQYLACLGPFALAAGFLSGRLKPLAAAVLIALGVLTWQQSRIYQDEETIWRDTLAKNPAAWMAHNNLGHLLAKKGELTGALREFQESLRIKPDFVSARLNLGMALSQQGKFDEAMREFDEALKIDPEDAKAHYTFGTFLAARGNAEEALGHFKESVRLKPDYVEAHNNLGVALARRGEVNEAITHFAEALRINPDFVKARENLDRALFQQEKIAEGSSP